jgi:C4-dicarboxylate-specific signal transduction histidine kinase
MTYPSNKTALQQMDIDLHDLCQPLTALQCRLEIGKMMGHEGALREAVDGGLEETQRMFEVIARIRQHLIRAQEFSK